MLRNVDDGLPGLSFLSPPFPPLLSYLGILRLLKCSTREHLQKQQKSLARNPRPDPQKVRDPAQGETA